jgi:hypothetical protein
MPLRAAVERVRVSIAAGDYQTSAHCLEDLRREAERSWNEAASVEQRQQVAGEVQDLLRWARETVIASRAHQQGKLLQFTRVRAYLGASAGHRDRLELNA